MSRQPKRRADELGAHVSTAGGAARAPGRAAELGSVVLQLFTKSPNRWAEPMMDAAVADAFVAERRQHGIRIAAAHDSYLINLASPDAVLFERSLTSFRAELERCDALGVELLVTHPGHATDGDAASGLARNAEAVEQAMEETGTRVRVLFETTAGTGRALGATFEELGALIARIGARTRPRIGVCLDTCHVFAAGYDLSRAYDEVIARFEDALGLDRLALFHLNDSAAPLGSRRDRHAHIGAGALGPGPFRRLVRDDRFPDVPKVIETPKDGDAVVADRANLRRLRRYRSGPHKGVAIAKKLRDSGPPAASVGEP